MMGGIGGRTFTAPVLRIFPGPFPRPRMSPHEGLDTWMMDVEELILHILGRRLEAIRNKHLFYELYLKAQLNDGHAPV